MPARGQDFRRECGHEDNRKVGSPSANVSVESDTVPLWQHDIHKDQIDRRGRPCQVPERLIGVGRLEYAIASPAQDALSDPTNKV